MRVRLLSSTTADQNILTLGGTTVIDQNVTLTTTWQRFSYSATVGSTAATLGSLFSYDPVGTAGANDYFEITGVQLELGSTASTYYPNQPTYATELVACQRYYYRWVTNGVSTAWAGTGMVYNTTTALVVVKLPVTMRTNPGNLETSGTASDYRVLAPGGGTGCSAVPVIDTSHYEVPLVKFTTAGSLTAGYGCAAGASTTNNAYLGFTAEL